MRFTLIVPYYQNPGMLRVQVDTWAQYPPEVSVIVVDDGSPEPATKILPDHCRAEVYRIDVDIPWNRNGARNLGANVAHTDWLLHVDVDHVLTPDYAWELAQKDLDAAWWYKFKRYRMGRADATRRKDALPDDARFGEVKPHVDSYLCQKALYWHVGGYDEDFSGSLGGSGPFLIKMAKAAPCRVLDDVALHVYTRDLVPDASDTTLDRGRERYEAIRKLKASQGNPTPISHMRFPWHRAR